MTMTTDGAATDDAAKENVTTDDGDATAWRRAQKRENEYVSPQLAAGYSPGKMNAEQKLTRLKRKCTSIGARIVPVFM